MGKLVWFPSDAPNLAFPRHHSLLVKSMDSGVCPHGLRPGSTTSWVILGKSSMICFHVLICKMKMKIKPARTIVVKTNELKYIAHLGYLAHNWVYIHVSNFILFSLLLSSTPLCNTLASQKQKHMSWIIRNLDISAFPLSVSPESPWSTRLSALHYVTYNDEWGLCGFRLDISAQTFPWWSVSHFFFFLQ